MRESAMGVMPAAVTPRLIFDNASHEEDIPQFLRGKAEEREPGDERNYVQEPEAPVAVMDPTEQLLEPVVSDELVKAPALEETSEPQPLNEDLETLEAAVGNLDEMTVDELRQQQEEIDRKIREKQLAEKQAVIAQIVNVVQQYKIPVEDLVEALGGMKIKRKGVKAKPKYRDPATGAIWTGRGKEPAWIKDKDREPFLID